uniref:Uncharacterized protein n=1 Tax=Anguilla anguilla TaxID=7936 RepID=A0A0E9UHP4_ANGAN
MVKSPVIPPYAAVSFSSTSQPMFTISHFRKTQYNSEHKLAKLMSRFG